MMSSVKPDLKSQGKMLNSRKEKSNHNSYQPTQDRYIESLSKRHHFGKGCKMTTIKGDNSSV